MTCWMACCVAASAGAPAAAAAAAVDCVGAEATLGRATPEVVNRDTANAMIAISATARMIVAIRPPREPVLPDDGLTVLKSDALLGSILSASPILDQVSAGSRTCVAWKTCL